MKNFYLLGLLGTVLLLVAASSCQQPAAAPDKPLMRTDLRDLSQAMNGIESVSLHPSSRFARPGVNRPPSELRRMMDRAVLDAFEKKGYSIAPVNEGEVEIAFAVGVTGEMTDQEMVQIFGLAPGIQYKSGIPRGAIVLALINRKLRTTIWRASGSASKGDRKLTAAEVQASLSDALDTLLENLPAR